MKKLIQIQGELIKENPSFPKNMCTLASKCVYDKLGFLPVAGFALTSNGVERHAWNVDGEGRRIDLTLYQFDLSAPKIVYAFKEDLLQKWDYFEIKKATLNLRKFIFNYNLNFFKL